MATGKMLGILQVVILVIGDFRLRLRGRRRRRRVVRDDFTDRREDFLHRRFLMCFVGHQSPLICFSVFDSVYDR